MLKTRPTHRGKIFPANHSGSLARFLLRGLAILLAFGFLTFPTGRAAYAAGERPGETVDARLSDESEESLHHYKGNENFARPAYTGEELKYLREHPVLRAAAHVD